MGCCQSSKTPTELVKENDEHIKSNNHKNKSKTNIETTKRQLSNNKNSNNVNVYRPPKNNRQYSHSNNNSKEINIKISNSDESQLLTKKNKYSNNKHKQIHNNSSNNNYRRDLLPENSNTLNSNNYNRVSSHSGANVNDIPMSSKYYQNHQNHQKTNTDTIENDEIEGTGYVSDENPLSGLDKSRDAPETPPGQDGNDHSYNMNKKRNNNDTRNLSRNNSSRHKNRLNSEPNYENEKLESRTNSNRNNSENKGNREKRNNEREKRNNERYTNHKRNSSSNNEQLNKPIEPVKKHFRKPLTTNRYGDRFEPRRQSAMPPHTKPLPPKPNNNNSNKYNNRFNSMQHSRSHNKQHNNNNNVNGYRSGTASPRGNYQNNPFQATSKIRVKEKESVMLDKKQKGQHDQLSNLLGESKIVLSTQHNNTYNTYNQHNQQPQVINKKLKRQIMKEQERKDFRERQQRQYSQHQQFNTYNYHNNSSPNSPNNRNESMAYHHESNHHQQKYIPPPPKDENNELLYQRKRSIDERSRRPTVEERDRKYKEKQKQLQLQQHHSHQQQSHHHSSHHQQFRRHNSNHHKRKNRVPPPPKQIPKAYIDGYESDETIYAPQFNRQFKSSSRNFSLDDSQIQISSRNLQQQFHSNNNNGKRRSKRKLYQQQQIIGLPDKEGELTEKEFYKKYWIEAGKLGEGSFARVRKITRKHDRIPFALKVIKKKGKSKEDLDALQREIDILHKINHTNVVRLTDWMYTKKRIYMVVEFCQGGDVFERILKQKTFSEMDAAHVIRQVASGLEHIHSKNIVHRDLKPDNLMYLTKDSHADIKIIDFGLAGDSSNGPLRTPCGTAHYVAPEVLSGIPYNTKADMWSLGVIIYMLLCGFPPFFEATGNQKRLYKLIKSGRYRFPSPYWDYISEGAKDLIRHLLVKDPKKRFSASQCLDHSWVGGKSAKKDDMSDIYMQQMKFFHSSKHFTNIKIDINNQKNNKEKEYKQPINLFANPKYAVDYNY